MIQSPLSSRLPSYIFGRVAFIRLLLTTPPLTTCISHDIRNIAPFRQSFEFGKVKTSKHRGGDYEQTSIGLSVGSTTPHLLFLCHHPRHTHQLIKLSEPTKKVLLITGIKRTSTLTYRYLITLISLSKKFHKKTSKNNVKTMLLCLSFTIENSIIGS